MLLYFEHQVFLALDNVLYYNNGTQRNQNKVINERYIEQVVSTVTKPSHSPLQNAEVCQSHCQRNIQSFLLSQFFCWRITEANRKILKSPLHFIAYVLSLWTSKAVLQFFYTGLLCQQQTITFRWQKLGLFYLKLMSLVLTGIDKKG